MHSTSLLNRAAEGVPSAKSYLRFRLIPSAEGLIFENENFGFGLISKIWLRSYSGRITNQLEHITLPLPFHNQSNISQKMSDLKFWKIILPMSGLLVLFLFLLFSLILYIERTSVKKKDVILMQQEFQEELKLHAILLQNRIQDCTVNI